MKRKVISIVLLLLLLVTAANSVMAQGMDLDNDGVPLRRDQCPRQAGPESNNGCPFQADGFVIELDPTSPPPPPPADSDGDGLSDPNDQCPNEHGLADNGGCPLPPPPNNPPSGDPDSDGDGTVDSGDECPTVSGPRENRGCPPSNPPNNPPGGDVPPPSNPPNGDNPPPFTPPLLPTHECFVTSANGNNINVRKEPNMSADVLGSLLPGVVYPAQGYVMNGAEVWFVLTGYVGSVGETGYSAGSVLLSSAICAPVADPGNPGSVGVPTGNAATDFESPDGGSPTLCHLTVGYDSPTWSDDFPSGHNSQDGEEGARPD